MAALITAIAAMNCAMTTSVAMALLLSDPALKSLREKRLPTVYTQLTAPNQRRRTTIKRDEPKKYSRQWYAKRGQQFSKRKARRERRAANAASRANAKRYREDFMEARRGLYPVPVDVIATDGQADTLWLSPFTKIGEVRKLIADRLGFGVPPAALLAGSSVMMDADVLLMYDFNAIIAGNCCGVPGGVPPPNQGLSVVIVSMGTTNRSVLVVAQKGNEAALRTALGDALQLPSSPQDMRINWCGASSDVSTAHVRMTLRGGGGGDDVFCYPCDPSGSSGDGSGGGGGGGGDNSDDDDDIFDRPGKKRRAQGDGKAQAKRKKRVGAIDPVGVVNVQDLAPSDDEDSGSESGETDDSVREADYGFDGNKGTLRPTSASATTRRPKRLPRHLRFCCRYDMRFHLLEAAVGPEEQDSAASDRFMCRCQRADRSRTVEACCFLCAVETIDKRGDIRMRCECGACMYKYIHRANIDKALLQRYQDIRLRESQGFDHMDNAERKERAKAQIDAAVMKKKKPLDAEGAKVPARPHLSGLSTPCAPSITTSSPFERNVFVHISCRSLLSRRPAHHYPSYNSAKMAGNSTGASARTHTPAGLSPCARALSRVSTASRKDHWTA